MIWWQATPAALTATWRDAEYGSCWKGIPRASALPG